ncbi:MAG: hypothetical protein NC115_01435 [Bacteroidales bacterium]|nr:hypothetical protein [Bacteroidales bacterium]
MFLTALLIGSLLVAAAIILYVDYLSESTLRAEIKGELPETSFVEVSDIKKEYGKEYGTTYKLKAHQKDGSKKDVEIRCKNGSVAKYSRVRI